MLVPRWRSSARRGARARRGALVGDSLSPVVSLFLLGALVLVGDSPARLVLVGEAHQDYGRARRDLSSWEQRQVDQFIDVTLGSPPRVRVLHPQVRMMKGVPHDWYSILVG